MPKPSSVPGVLSVADGSLDEDPIEGLEGVVPGVERKPEPLPLRASPTVVFVPSPLKLCPDTSSYVVIPAIVTPKTSAAATTGRFQLLTRARYTVPSVNTPGTGACSGLGFAWTVTSRSCSPVRLKKCWKTVPPQVAIALTTPAPRIVPYTPK
ncbi:hypothetical protein [Streptomyces mirabilis]|uniref:hypothetical protein n=1 Tax=Streptomyces mirabilis TaxID=68239 RepID=UPI0015A57679